MKIVYLSPSYFNIDSIIGGGERYIAELAKWTAKLEDVTVVSFGDCRKSFIEDAVKYEIFPSSKWKHFNTNNPFSLTHIFSLGNFDILHVHQICTFVSDVGVLFSRMSGKKIFGTDHGGGGAWVLNRKLPVYRCYNAVIAQSKLAAGKLALDFKVPIENIPGGVDTERYRPIDKLEREKKILFVGRLLPHKGADVLIKAFNLLSREDYSLTLIGKVGDEDYFKFLKSLINDDKRVTFIHDADDQQVVKEYQSALVTVLPSVAKDYLGNETDVAELMGFTLLESQACGTPVICSDAGAMSEFILVGETGFVAEQSSSESLADKIIKLITMIADDGSNLNQKCREHALKFSWQQVVDQHLELYKSYLD